ncbi:hypothetical protein TIFTF001_029075 [Ficus carica]|uniref:Uncharacterized protein n=1 Tax=Ficus carica TaxID=3494 RepID=A0AA88DV57_FICCA|nr:hypothetical protein TIFTF001_029075 [Ficus carica]
MPGPCARPGRFNEEKVKGSNLLLRPDWSNKIQDETIVLAERKLTTYVYAVVVCFVIPGTRPRAFLRSRSSFGHYRRGFPSVWVYAVLAYLAGIGVVGYSVSRSELDCQGPGYSGWLARPWLDSGRALGERVFTCTVTLPRVTCKREAPRSDGETGGVSATGITMLKLGHSGDPIRSTPWCSRQVDRLQARRRYVSNRPAPRIHGQVSGDTRGAATNHARGTTCKGSTVRVSNIIPRYYLTQDFVVGANYAINSHSREDYVVGAHNLEASLIIQN